jgi:activator of HSP90 ATPase
VEHREDGKNVNGWHWEEKNRLEWSRQHLGTLLTSIPAAETGTLKITKLREVNGEVCRFHYPHRTPA